jgi:hypothetical protein
VRTREPLLARQRTPLAVETGPSGWPGSPGPALAPRTGAGTLTDRRPGEQAGAGFPITATSGGPTVAAQSPQAAPAWPGAGTGGYGQQAAPARVVSVPLGQNFAESAAPAQPRADDTTELPIFREIEAVWFRTHGNRGVNANVENNWAMPTAGYPPPPVVSVGSPVAAGAPVSGSGYSGGYAAPSVGPGGNGPASRYAGPGTSRSPGNGGNGGARPSGPAPAAPPPPAAYAPPEVPSSAVPPPGTDDQRWRTAADEGWQRASAAAKPAPSGTTRSGLPKRTPQAQLVPGGVTQASGQNRAKRTPDEVRGLLSAYHRGVQRGRSAGAANAETRSTEETTR